MRVSMRAKLVAVAALTVVLAGVALVAFRPGETSEDQCSKPISERVGGWAC